MKYFTIILIGILLLFNSSTLAQTDNYELLSFTMSSGGGQSSGGKYDLTANIAQPDVETMSGGEYDMSGGFQPIITDEVNQLYLPVILQNS